MRAQNQGSALHPRFLNLGSTLFSNHNIRADFPTVRLCRGDFLSIMIQLQNRKLHVSFQCLTLDIFFYNLGLKTGAAGENSSHISFLELPPPGQIHLKGANYGKTMQRTENPRH